MGYQQPQNLRRLFVRWAWRKPLSSQALATEGIQHGHMLLHQKNLTLQLADQKAMN